MLDATQPWLPLLGDEPQTDPPVSKSKRRPLPAPQATPPGRDERAARQASLGVASSLALTVTEALRLLGEPLSDEAERIERLHGALPVRTYINQIGAAKYFL